MRYLRCLKRLPGSCSLVTQQTYSGLLNNLGVRLFAMPEITFRLVEAFYAVAIYRNVSHAARALHVTPSAITHSVKKLEKACGANLTHPTRRGIEITEVGEKILSEVELILSLRTNLMNNYRTRAGQLTKRAITINTNILSAVAITAWSWFVLPIG